MSESRDFPLTGSPVEPVVWSNVQPALPMYQDTTDTEIASSSLLSLRRISVRCAHGQARET